MVVHLRCLHCLLHTQLARMLQVDLGLPVRLDRLDRIDNELWESPFHLRVDRTFIR